MFAQLRSHLTELTLDQIPALGEMQRYLEQLSFMEPPAVKHDLLLEQVKCLFNSEPYLYIFIYKLYPSL